MRCTTMRVAVMICVAVGLAGQARADGFYFTEGIGGTSYRGELRAYGSGALRFQIGAGWRRGVPSRPHWALEIVGGGLVNEADLAIDCYGDECDADTSRDGEYNFVGIDIKRRWPVLQSRWHGLGARFALHAGPRMYWGLGALTGYDGVGVNAGAAIEGDIWVIGYAVDFGFDAMALSIPVDSVVATAPYVLVSGRVGWL